ncbi:hypothetical protein AURDEDRAFT_129773 [Auricularia subglabra TFB-10046 SS5]|uniref:Uncharacterized protein n=1 Tax=Auricularia subglabra (strain TFB-10046 / SS5) TaxID=717982 RepID=J0WV51_AURST|nr:hypothetical protein AURDEDRAFT_129773 [Auricularia subglabra TFB-10046 SS5]
MSQYTSAQCRVTFPAQLVEAANQPAQWTSVHDAHRTIAHAPSGATPMLEVGRIGPHDLAPLTALVSDHLSTLRGIYFQFEAVNLEGFAHAEYLHALAGLWTAFAQPAPELRSLSLLAGQNPIYQIPYSFLGFMRPPRLSYLYLAGFQLEEKCDAFGGVAHVRVDLGVLVGTDVPSLGELFPGANTIHISGLQSFSIPVLDEDGSETTAPAAYLHSVPRVTAAHPVQTLKLEWAPLGVPSRRPTDAFWITQCAPFVGSLEVVCPDHVDVRLAALSILGAHAHGLSVEPSVHMGPGYSTLAISVQAPAMHRARVDIVDAAIGAHIGNMGAHGLLQSVQELSVTVSRLRDVLVGLHAPTVGFTRLLVVLDNALPTPEYLAALCLPRLTFITTLAIKGPSPTSGGVEVDESTIAAFRTAVTPNARSVQIDRTTVTVVNAAN